MESNPNYPTFVFDDLELHWQMTRCEKFAFASLLAQIKPEVAIEIGSYRGGSLQVVAAHSDKVYSLDISPSCRDEHQHRFDNVEFVVGDSKAEIGNVLKRIRESGKALEFVLVDGDHSRAGVRGDMEALAKVQPTHPLWIVFHDSFHPPVRQGILDIDWQSLPHVHYVEIDFVPGVFHYLPFDTASPKSMYGGFAVAKMMPQKRQGPLQVLQSQKHLFSTVHQHSRYAPLSSATRLKKSVYRIAKRVLGKSS